MTFRFLALLLSLVIVAPAAYSAEKQAKKQATDEEILARLREHALKKRAARTTATAPAAAPTASTESVAASIAQNPPAKEAAAETSPTKSDTAPKKETAEEDTTVLPEIQVRKDRITELDRQVAKQNREIRREKQNTKPTALDETLNGPKTSKWLAIFGGQSSEDRANIASERVAMMEDERDLLEAIAQTEDPEEKALLQRTLDAMRAMRRDLEAALR